MRTTGRVYTHMVSCKTLPKKLKTKALSSNAQNALGAKVGGSGSIETSDEEEEEIIDVDAEPAASSSKDVFRDFKAQGKEDDRNAKQTRQDKINGIALRWLCDACIPPRNADNSLFKELVAELDPTAKIYSSSTFATKISAEAAYIRLLVVKRLKKRYGLTVSYDGGTLLRPQSVYTIHVTDGVTRETFFIEGNEASGVSHTGEHIKEIVMEVRRLQSTCKFFADHIVCRSFTRSVPTTLWLFRPTALEIPRKVVSWSMTSYLPFSSAPTPTTTFPTSSRTYVGFRTLPS